MPPELMLRYQKLVSLIEEYGFELINKVSSGGGMWIAGDRHDEALKDFVAEGKRIGCEFAYYEDSKALSHHSGWCHRVDPEYLNEYEKNFGSIHNLKTIPKHPAEDMVLKAVRKSGFEYADKRLNGGSLWYVAGEEEGKPLAEKCKELGVRFAFTAKGGRATKKRPGWYSL